MVDGKAEKPIHHVCRCILGVGDPIGIADDVDIRPCGT